MEEDEDAYFNKNWHNLQPLNLDSPQSYSKLWSMVVVKDSTFPTKNLNEEQLSVFPPCNHENLNPSHFNLQPEPHSPPPSFPSSPFSFRPPDLANSPSPAVVTLTPFAKWWALTAQILRSGFANIGSYFGSDGNRKSFGNVALAVTVVLWWIYARRRRTRKSVDRLMQIITEKDEKIMQLLSQIAKLNEVLLSRHKALLASK